jgi:hypothetical protein
VKRTAALRAAAKRVELKSRGLTGSGFEATSAAGAHALARSCLFARVRIWPCRVLCSGRLIGRRESVEEIISLSPCLLDLCVVLAPRPLVSGRLFGGRVDLLFVSDDSFL